MAKCRQRKDVGWRLRRIISRGNRIWRIKSIDQWKQTCLIRLYWTCIGQEETEHPNSSPDLTYQLPRLWPDRRDLSALNEAEVVYQNSTRAHDMVSWTTCLNQSGNGKVLRWNSAGRRRLEYVLCSTRLRCLCWMRKFRCGLLAQPGHEVLRQHRCDSHVLIIHSTNDAPRRMDPTRRSAALHQIINHRNPLQLLDRSRWHQSTNGENKYSDIA